MLRSWNFAREGNAGGPPTPQPYSPVQTHLSSDNATENHREGFLRKGSVGAYFRKTRVKQRVAEPGGGDKTQRISTWEAPYPRGTCNPLGICPPCTDQEGTGSSAQEPSTLQGARQRPSEKELLHPNSAASRWRRKPPRRMRPRGARTSPAFCRKGAATSAKFLACLSSWLNFRGMKGTLG